MCIVASNSTDPGIAARTLANIADVMGCMAGKIGGLRSGPAANQSWEKAFHFLEVTSVSTFFPNFDSLRNPSKRSVSVSAQHGIVVLRKAHTCYDLLPQL